MGFNETTRLASPTGATLSLRCQPAEGAGKAIVVIAHGLVEHGARYAEFAAFLASRGYHVYAHDHRGHGLTEAPGASRGRFAWRDGARLVRDDMLAVRDLAARTHPGLPIILFGHSMGGMIALAAAIADPTGLAGLAIWNTNISAPVAAKAARWMLRAERFFKGSDVPSSLAIRATFEKWAKTIPQARTPFDWLSRDAKAVAQYIADPLCGADPTVSLWLDIFAMIGDCADKQQLSRLPKDLPVHLVGGGHDPATDDGRAVQWLANRLQAIGMTAVDTTIFDDMRHETLHEIGRQDVMKAFAAWTDGAVGKSAGTHANG